MHIYLPQLAQRHPMKSHGARSLLRSIVIKVRRTRVLSLAFKQSVIDRAYEDDPAVAASEWGGQFRNDLESYVSPEVVEACTAHGVYQRPFEKHIAYKAHADSSGGSQDSFTLAIGHVEDGVGVLDVLVERRPPFSPESVVAEMCEVLAGYSLHEVTGDRFASGFNSEAFRKHGVEYWHSDMTTSDYFAGFLPILNSRRTQLLDHKRLTSQLCALERRASRIGAKDSIGHPNGHDDIAASVAGLMVRLVGTRDYQVRSFHEPVASRTQLGDLPGYGIPAVILPAEGCLKPGGDNDLYTGGATGGGFGNLGWSPNSKG
jgi:hypothetical protein